MYVYVLILHNNWQIPPISPILLSITEINTYMYIVQMQVHFASCLQTAMANKKSTQPSYLMNELHIQ